VTWQANAVGSARVFEAVSAAGVGVLVYASSVGAYSPGPGRRVDESWPTHSVPAAAYGREKAYVERLLDAFEARHPDTRVVRLRPAFIFQREAASEQRARPLEPIYPIVYVDALVVKVRDGAQVRNKAAHLAVGVDLDGIKHVLGIWVQSSEGAKFWAGVMAELANRGVRDILIACCDGPVRRRQCASPPTRDSCAARWERSDSDASTLASRAAANNAARISHRGCPAWLWAMSMTAAAKRSIGADGASPSPSTASRSDRKDIDAS
jgi:hypothetical protein